jgi:dihydropyrimidinase
MIHAENGDLVQWLTEKLDANGWTDPFYHSQARMPIVEGEATHRAIVLAELVQNPVLFVHVSAAVRAPASRDLDSRYGSPRRNPSGPPKRAAFPSTPRLFVHLNHA